ncbi:SH3 domain-containing protein [Burkholderia guangdongensis]|uniref:SH3 domain-containing protein n=1 Tax=Burkholderia guangdongensis TaxID=1792500 RepID=UPI0015C6BDE0|nr:SH3 domain-containing protein [Burkholderia guangdongensis]
MKNAIVRCLCIGFLGLLALPGAAFAQTEAYTNGPANLRAGPAPDYPLVAQIPEGVLVSVIGCVSDYTWCDVALPNLRGWIYAGRLDYPYEGGEVPLLDYGATIGFPIEVFAIDSYWDQFYVNQPFFRDRDHFRHRVGPRMEPRIGPGGIPPAHAHPQIERGPGGVIGQPGIRPSGPPGGWGGGREPRPQVVQPGIVRNPGGPMMHAPGPAPRVTVTLPPPGRQGGGGGGERGAVREGGGGHGGSLD